MADLPRAARGNARAIHDVRVASRRLRAALPIAGEAAGVDVRSLTREIRRVTRAFAGVREAGVVRATIRELGRAGAWSADAVREIDGRCVRWRDSERKQARGALRKLDRACVAREIEGVIARLDASVAEPAMAAAFVAETRRRLRAFAGASDEAGIVYAVEPLHRLRIAAKKLRYVLETGSRALPRVGPRAVGELRRLQSRLGRLHDLQMAQQFVRAVAAQSAASPLLAAELADLDRALELRCRTVHAGILRRRARLGARMADVAVAVTGLLVPRAAGRMARMRIGSGRRRVAR